MRSSHDANGTITPKLQPDFVWWLGPGRAAEDRKVTAGQAPGSMLLQSGFHKVFNSICDALSRPRQLFDGPVFGMSCGDPSDGRAIEKTTGQRGRQQLIALSDGQVAIAHPLEPELRSAASDSRAISTMPGRPPCTPSRAARWTM